MSIERVVSWFSAGVTSAVATKLTIEKYADKYPVTVAYCDTGSEHDDNLRFLRDVEGWLDIEITILKNPKYEDTFDVYRSTGWIMMGQMGAKCSYELKKLVRQDFENVDTDLQVFGFDADEAKRAERFTKNNPLVQTWFPLIEHRLVKDDCRVILANAGIREPVTYSMGFKNANCLKTGCVKGGLGYWNHYKSVFPEAFERMAQLERELGYAVNRRKVKGKRIPIFLDELTPDLGSYDAEPSFQCGLFCGLHDND